MWKQFFLWGLGWLQKKISNMSDAELMALDERIDKRLGITQGSKEDIAIDSISKRVFPILREVVKLL